MRLKTASRATVSLDGFQYRFLEDAMRRTLLTSVTTLLLAGTSLAQSPPLPPERTFDTPEEAFQIKLDALMERCPELGREEAEATFNRDGNRYGEALSYAQSYCVPINEANRRMALQEAWTVGERTEELNALIARIVENEPTYTDSWIQHVPTYGFAFGFSENAAETLARYTTDPVYIGVDQPGAKAAYSENDSRDFMMRLGELGVGFATAGYDTIAGVFQVDLLSETTEAIDALVSTGKLVVPAWVKFNTRPPLPHAAPPPAVDPDRLAGFPRLRTRTDGMPQTLVGVSDVRATLVLRDDCLAFEIEPGMYADPRGGAGNEILTALWQKTQAPDLSDPERIGVLDRLSGNRIHVGDRVVLSGLQPGTAEMYDSIHTDADRLEKAATGTHACPGPYRYVEGFTEAGAFEAARRSNLIDRWIEHGGLNRNEAEARVAENEALAARFETLRETLLRDHSDVVADFTYDGDLYHMPNGRPQQQIANLMIVEGAAAGDVLPVELERHVRISRVPLARDGLDALEAQYESLLGDAVTLRTSAYDGSITIMAEDVRPIAAAMRAGDLVESERVRVSLTPVPRDYRNSRDGWYKSMKAMKSWTGYDGVRAMVKPFLKDIWTRRLPESEIDGTTADLLKAGYDDPARIQDMEARGIGPMTAIAHHGSGMDFEIRAAILAGNIAVAELVELNTDAPGPDGLRSTLTFRITDTVFGDLAPGDTIDVRMAGGVTEDGRHVVGPNEKPLFAGLPDALEQGATYLIRPSSGLYRFDTLLATGAEYDPGPDAAYTLPTYPTRVEGDRIVRDYGVQSVEGLKTFLSTSG